MNIEPHNLIDPLHEKLPHLIRHEKLYRMIHRQLMKKWFQYFVLFFIIGSICSIIYSSFEESAPYHNILYAFNYLASFIFTIEYGLRIVAAPVQYASCNHAWKARLRYLFSFYGLIDFVAIIPFMVIYVYKETPHVHLVVLAYVLIIFKLIRYSRSFQMIGTVLRTVREELVTAYTACGIMLGFSGILMYYIERYAQPEAFENIGDGFWWAIVAFTTRGLRRHLPDYSVGTAIEQHHQPDWHRHDCHSYRYHQLGLHEHADRKKAKRKKQFINVIYGTRNPT